MGRVEEALKRAVAARKGVREVTPADRADSPFVSAWRFEGGAQEQAPVERETPREIAAVTKAESGPASAPPSPRPSALRAEVPRRPEPRLQIESQLAMAWPQPFGTELAGKLVVQRDMDPAAVEQYAAAATELARAQSERGVKTVLVAGATSGDGATLTAINLAFMLNGTDARRVLLVDANLAAPRIHRLLQVSLRPGLSEWLKSDAGSKPPTIGLTERLAMVPAGSAHDPGVLSSDRMRDALAVARQSFDWIVVDGPPASAAGAGDLAALMDAVVLVVHADKTARDAAASAADLLGRDRVLGVVLNRATSGR